MRLRSILFVSYFILAFCVGVYTFYIVNIDDAELEELEAIAPTVTPLPILVVVVVIVIILCFIQRRYNKNGSTRGKGS